MSPAPIPVPIVIIMTWSWPRPAPSVASAHAAALASFSTRTGRPVRSSTCRATSSFRQARFGANTIFEPLSSTNPAAPMPTASISYLESSSFTASDISSTVFAAFAAGVGRLTISTIEPFSSTTPAAIFVPPTSTPIARLILRLFRVIGSSGWLPVRHWPARPVRQDRVDARQRVPDSGRDDIARIGQPMATVAVGCPGSGDPPGSAADRTPRAFWGLVGRLWRLVGRGRPAVTLLAVRSSQRLPDLALDLTAELVAHALGAGPDQPALHLAGQTRGPPLP